MNLPIRGEAGMSSIVSIMMLAVVVLGGIAYVNDDIVSTMGAREQMATTDDLADVNRDVVQQVAQLWQTQTLTISSSKTFTWSKPAGEVFWAPATGPAATITLRNCNHARLNQNDRDKLMLETPSNQQAMLEKLCKNHMVDTQVAIEGMDEGPTGQERVYLKLTSRSERDDKAYKNEMKARIAMSPASTAEPIPPGPCPYDDPTFRKEFFIGGGRHMAGWAMVGKGINMAHNEVPGYTSSRDLKKSPGGKFTPTDTATHKVTGMGFMIGNYNHKAYVYRPKTGNQAECTISVGGFRHNGWNAGCFTEKTRLRMADGTDKNVGDVRIGDMVLNPVTGKGQAVDQITYGIEYEPVIALTAGGKTVEVTGLHPFMTRGGLRQARQLSTADELLTEGGGYARITSVERLPLRDQEWVYNFVLSGDSGQAVDHMVLADGVVAGDRYLQDQLVRELLRDTAMHVSRAADAEPNLASFRPEL